MSTNRPKVRQTRNGRGKTDRSKTAGKLSDLAWGAKIRERGRNLAEIQERLERARFAPIGELLHELVSPDSEFPRRPARRGGKSPGDKEWRRKFSGWLARFATAIVSGGYRPKVEAMVVPSSVPSEGRTTWAMAIELLKEAVCAPSNARQLVEQCGDVEAWHVPFTEDWVRLINAIFGLAEKPERAAARDEPANPAFEKALREYIATNPNATHQAIKIEMRKVLGYCRHEKVLTALLDTLRDEGAYRAPARRRKKS